MKSKFLMALSLLCIITASCEQKEAIHPSTERHFFSGRETLPLKDRINLYRANVPISWSRQDISDEDSILDTKKAICEYFIRDDEGTIRLTFHTFPFLDLSQRISPNLQILRWKQQFDPLNEFDTVIQNVSWGGFYGLFIETSGMIKGVPSATLGWSMHLATEYARELELSTNAIDRMKRADYTFKATGPPHVLKKYREVITQMVQSFELIDELPLSL